MSSRGEWRLVSLALVVLVLGACTGDDDDDSSRPTSTTVDVAPITMTVTRADLVSPRRAASALAPETVAATVSTLQAFFEATVVGPVTAGEAGEIAPLFTPDALEHAVGADRATVFDEGVPQVTSLSGRTDVRITALAGDEDEPALVIAKIDWDVRDGAGNVHIHRTGELSLLPVFGFLKVAAYELTVERTVSGEHSSSRASGGTTP